MLLAAGVCGNLLLLRRGSASVMLVVADPRRRERERLKNTLEMWTEVFHYPHSVATLLGTTVQLLTNAIVHHVAAT